MTAANTKDDETRLSRASAMLDDLYGYFTKSGVRLSPVRAHLTINVIGSMILAMSRKILATLLVCGWIILSGFDLLEDLHSSDQTIVRKGSQERTSPSMAGGLGTIANNIVESALRPKRLYTVLFSSSNVALALDATFEVRTSFRLHKLYRVFLI